MTLTRKILSAAIAATALAAMPLLAADNTAAPRAGWGNCGNPSAGAGYGADGGRMSRMHGFGSGNPAAMVAGHLAALKVELKITREQEGAWEKFAGKAAKQAESMPAQMEQMRSEMFAKDVPAPERLAKRTELARQHIANMESMTAAVGELYAALTPEQKKIADDLLTRGPGGMGGPGGMRYGHGFRS